MLSQPARFFIIVRKPICMYGSSSACMTAELLHVLRLLFLDRVDDVVDRDHAHQVSRLAHDRHDDEVVVGDDPRHLLAVCASARR